MKMRKWRIILLSALAVACVCMAGALLGCKPSEPAPHEHNYTVWRHDDSGHWKECEAADGATTEKSNHSFIDGKCECGLVDTRTFGSVAGKVTLIGGKNPTDYSNVRVDFGDDVSVGAIDENGNFTATHVTVGKDYDVTVSHDGYSSYAAFVRVDAEGETVTLEKPFVLEYNRFDYWLGWDKAQHDLTHVNDAEPTVGNSMKTLNVISRDTYADVAVSLWMKNGNSRHVQGIQGLFFKFEDGKYMFARCEKMSDGNYKLQWAKNFNGTGDWAGNKLISVIESYVDFQNPLTQEQKEKFDGEDGLRVTLLRKNNTLYTFVDGELLLDGTMTLPNEYADDQVRFGFWDYDSKENAVWRFAVEETVDDYEAKIPEYTAPAVTAENGTVTFDQEKYKHGEPATITATPAEGYVLGTASVNGKEVGAAFENGTYTFAVTGNITVSVSFIPSVAFETVTFTVPAERQANGMQITLSREGEEPIVGTVTNNRFTAENVKPGLWKAVTTVYGVEVALKDVNVIADTVEIDMSGVFGSNTAVSFGNEKTYVANTDVANYAVNADITGDAYFGMKIQSATDTSGMKNDAARFGLYIMYEDKELDITYVIKQGKWKISECGNNYEEAAIESYLETLKTDGIYMVVYRQGESGDVHLYLGTSKTNLTEVKVFKQKADISKGAIKKFGAYFWKGDYTATVTDLTYGKTIAQALGEEEKAIAVTGAGDVTQGVNKVGNIAVRSANVYEDVTVTIADEPGYRLYTFSVNEQEIPLSALQVNNGKYTYTLPCYQEDTLTVAATFIDYAVCDVTLTVKGHKTGEKFNLSGAVTVTNDMDEGDLRKGTLTDGVLTLTDIVTPGTYTVTVDDDNYHVGKITLEKNATTASVMLEYKRFDLWMKWDEAQHDFSHVNDENPTIGNDGKTLNVISRDSYDDVVVSLWMKKGNSVVNKDIQGIIVQFEDKKIAALRCENKQIDNKPSNIYKLQWVGGSDWGNQLITQWVDFLDPLNDAQHAELASNDGLKVTIVRKGNVLHTLVGDKYVPSGKITLPETYADDKVHVGFYDNTSAANATWKFDIHAVDNLDTKTFDTVMFRVDAAYHASVKAITLSRDGETNITGTVADNTITAQNVKGGLWTARVDMTVFGMETSVSAPVWIESSTAWLNLQSAMETSLYTPADLTQKREYTANSYYSVATEITGDAWFVSKLTFDATNYSTTKNDGKTGDLRIGFRMYCGEQNWDHEADATLLFNGTDWQGGTCSNKSNWQKSTAISAEAKAALYGDGMYFAVFRNASTGELAYYVGASKGSLVKLTWAEGKEQIYPHCKDPIIRVGIGFWVDAGQKYTASATETMYYGSAQAFADAGYTVQA